MKHKSAYRCLRIVPRDLRNIVFIAFHANPIGGHFGLNKTVICIRLYFFWPGLSLYCKKLITSYTGCRLANATRFPTNELVYNFPIDAPIYVLHIDGYTVGANINFAGNKGFFVVACDMCTFTVAKPVINPSAMVTPNIYW